MSTGTALHARSLSRASERGTRSYHANLGAGIDGLAVCEHEVPRPGAGEVLVRVWASSLSFRELMILRGWYPLPIKPDVVPVSDGAGEVVEVGEGVSRVAVGDRVSASIPAFAAEACDWPIVPRS